MHFIINILLFSIAVFLVAKLLPGVHIKNFGTAIVVAFVYGLVSFFLGWLFILLSLPFIIITFGLFKLVVNASLLWITDRLVPGFKIDGIGSTLLAAVLITIIDGVLKNLLFRQW